MAKPRYSIVVPVFNRPDELDALIKTVVRQTFSDFEVIIVDDGSTLTSEKIFEKYESLLTIRYFFKPNTGPGPSRNFGFEKAHGAYLVVFDSDCQIPPHYLAAVDAHLAIHPLDAWGGPDRGHEDFTPLQQAMANTMSSILTTGGIRGGTSKNFQPRSFNMGMSSEAFKKTGGFHFDRFAEDIELSIRMKNLGLEVGLIPEAFVYHQRRSSLRDFFRQVANFGKGRILVGRSHPGEVKLVHWLPTFFLLGLILLFLLLIFKFSLGAIALVLFVLYFIGIAIDSLYRSKSLQVSLLSIPAAFVQLTGYGWGFLKEKFKPSR